MKSDRRAGLRYDNTPRRLPPARRFVSLLFVVKWLLVGIAIAAAAGVALETSHCQPQVRCSDN